MTVTVYMMLGLPGSGKTTLSAQLSSQLGVSKFSLDDEYFSRVPNVQQEQRDFAIEREIAESIKERVAALIREGESAVLDFCPWRRHQREEYYRFIKEHGAVPLVYYLPVERDELLRRLEVRNALKSAAYQFMTAAMLSEFYDRFDPPTEDENVRVIQPAAILIK